MTKISELPLASSVGQYDLVPIVQNGATKAARASMFSTASTSTGSAGASSGTQIRPETYGAKSDGIILTDLVVSQGSTSITSNIGPFQSTGVDAGKIVYWRAGTAGWGSGIISTVQNSKQATLTAPAASSSQVDGGPNACAVFGTDSTSAFNQAYTAAQAEWTNAGFDRRYVTPGREVKLSAGVYVVKPLNTMKAGNIVTSGEGMYNTIIACVEPGNIYTLNDFNASISYAFGGEVLNWTFKNLRLVNPVLIQGSSSGSKYNIGIQDNANGSVTVENVSFTGFKYGYASTSGGDFSRLSGCYFNLCDVGTYFGPGAQQLEFLNCDWSQIREGLVLEGVQNWHAGSNCHWQDPIVSGVTIEGKPSGQKTRFGIASDVGGGAWYSGSMIIDGSPWFESNSGNNGGTAPRLIWINGDGPYGPAFDGLVVRDAHVISGGNQVSGGTNSFVEINSKAGADRPVLLDNVDVGGSYINYMINCSGAGDLRPTLRDCSFDESKIQMVRNSSQYRYIKRNGNYHGFTAV